MILVSYWYLFQVIADVVSIIMEKIDIVTLDMCTGLLPPLTDLLQSGMDR